MIELFKELGFKTEIDFTEPIIIRLLNNKKTKGIMNCIVDSINDCKPLVEYGDNVEDVDTFSITTDNIQKIDYFEKWIKLLNDPYTGISTYPILLDIETSIFYEYGIVSLNHIETGFSAMSGVIYIIPECISISTTIDNKKEATIGLVIVRRG